MELPVSLKGKKAIYISLGCKLNFAETSALADQLASEGVSRADKGEPADLCIINTCTVTEVANHKSRQAIHKLVRDNPQALTVVMGCYAQMSANEVRRITGVDLVVGMEQKGQVIPLLRKALSEREAAIEDIAATPSDTDHATPDPAASTSDLIKNMPDSAAQSANSAADTMRQTGDHALHESFISARKDIQTFVPSCSRGSRTRYFLKVQDGCDYFCTYCAIPYARGKSRNTTIASLVSQAEDVARRGGKEIVITGVNIGDFGRTTGESFYDLIQALDQVEGISRYRISSIEPNLLTPEIIDFCARSRAFMPHFHIPLQSGSDEVLRLMHRRYDTEFFYNRIQYIKKVMPDAFIGVDIMVGCRGETPECFEAAYDFAQRLDISQYHVFSYSERPGTAALRIPYIVDEREKHARSQRIIRLSEEKRQAFYARYIGQKREVLTEHAKHGMPLHGFTDNYIRVELPELSASASNTDNRLVQVCLGGFNADHSALIGKIIRYDR
ncbi:MAG: tRNA (N(6)-L-threonylcarbamoyladenosine(37)-C(2))-methylthiotransferase MtaB [Prevotellaceae bacterium]|nr:tRNA (N(6)-L-threonylcarbamoyladenosine(37)-C(2))-methylthiotransferase MtaB [Prevotellaceae bacterium]MDY3856470.1 tRNA (N(6)-L-threonylcarbamoyladenosine(37)-C(2))-methylthiotransferase MtaB [Bacteroidaceae bacterium]